MADAGIDAYVLSNHFRELQQEKKKLENKLEHLRMKRKDLESKQDTVARRNLLLNQKNENMSRTVNIAKMKVQETQLHVDKMQKLNDELQKNVASVKKQILQEEKRREDQMESYQIRYDELADNFRNAVKYYVDPVLCTEEGMWKASCREKENHLAEEEGILSSMTEQLEKLKIKKDVPEEKPPKSLWRQYLDVKNDAMSLFQAENQCADAAIQKLSNAVSQSKMSMEQVEESLRKFKKGHLVSEVMTVN